MLQPESIFVIPKHGFVMDNIEPEDATTNKPEKGYRNDIAYIGDEKKIEYYPVQIANSNIKIGRSQNDSLVVLNEAEFYTCPNCGYTEIDKQAADQSRDSIIKQHNNSRGYACENTCLSRVSLGHKFETDVVVLKFINHPTEDFDQAISILYALINGLSERLNIERSELAGCLKFLDNKIDKPSYIFIIFDNTPGGAGYVKSLADNGKLVLQDIINKAISL